MRLNFVLLTCAALTLASISCGGDDDDDGTSDGNGSSGGAGNSAAAADCDENACLTCFNNGGGVDCADECKGCEDGAGDGDETGSGGDGSAGMDGTGTAAKKPECTKDHDCGISFECLSCRLTDGEGWCFQTEACKYDSDCGVDGKCGYNVESGEYRCLPKENCE